MYRSKQRSRRTFAFGALALVSSLGLALASSHREGPFITEMPKVDGTDFYMFTSYEAGRQDFVTLVANYMPLQDTYGGPNYFTLDPEARHEIHVDNDGDALEDITFRFQFRNFLENITLQIGDPGNEKTVSVPLRTVGPVTAQDDSNLNDKEFFKLKLPNTARDLDLHPDGLQLATVHGDRQLRISRMTAKPPAKKKS